MLYSTDLLRHLRKIIGINIHTQRTRKRMPLGVLSSRSGLSRDLLDFYEIGKGEMFLDHLLKIACALDVDVGAFLESRREG